MHPVIYYDNESIKRDNKWVIKEKGTYTVTVNVETMKVEVEKLDVVYLVGSVYQWKRVKIKTMVMI